MFGRKEHSGRETLGGVECRGDARGSAVQESRASGGQLTISFHTNNMIVRVTLL